MLSRYDFMEDGTVVDSVSGSKYPDPLSLNYLNFKWRSLPRKDVMTDSKILFFWREPELYYGTAELDDIVLTLNGISHKNFLQAGDNIYFPDTDDIKKSFEKDR